MSSICRSMYKGKIAEEYHDNEWCKPNHDDRFQFEMLCLEGASVGLSWAIILNKRDNYKKAFYNFDIDSCSVMTDNELENILKNHDIIRNRNKVFSVRNNAFAVKKIQAEFGSFDNYVWSFTKGNIIDGHWKKPEEIPTVSDISIAMSKDMKKRGMSFVGKTITYSFLQSVGIVNDHLDGCNYR